MRARQAARATLIVICASMIVAWLVSAAEAAFPGRNGAIAFVRTYPHTNHGDIWKMKSDGSSAQRMTTDPRPDLAPAWNPTGSRIIYERATENGIGDQPHQLVVKDADGRPSHVVGVSNLEADAAWAPEGPVVIYLDLFLYSGDAAPSIGTLNVRTGLETGFPLWARTPLYPAWSPDGSRIAAVAPYRNGEGRLRNEIITMNGQGRDRTRLTYTPGDELFPDWSPDGRRILFVRQHNDAASDIFVIDAHGRNEIRLTDTDLAEGSAAFSPNGRRVVFDRCCYGESLTSEIFVMHADGTHVIRLTHNDADDTRPDWQPRPRGR